MMPSWIDGQQNLRLVGTSKVPYEMSAQMFERTNTAIYHNERAGLKVSSFKVSDFKV